MSDFPKRPDFAALEQEFEECKCTCDYGEINLALNRASALLAYCRYLEKVAEEACELSDITFDVEHDFRTKCIRSMRSDLNKPDDYPELAEYLRRNSLPAPPSKEGE